MARSKKNGKSVSLVLDRVLFNTLEAYCAETFLTKTATIEKALLQMFEREGFELSKGEKINEQKKGRLND